LIEMSDNCAANLRNYQIQLQQVEAALISDSNNAELNKLKNDLIVSYYQLFVYFIKLFNIIFLIIRKSSL
jgi:hypothetical protein